MREPLTANPSDLDSVPDEPAVFLLWASDGKPYLARTALLRRRLRRLKLNGVAERIEYWPVRSQIESSLVHLELAQRYFPEDWQRRTRLRAPSFVRLTTDNAFPRTVITSRLGKGLFYGPFSSRGAAEHFEGGLLDLFQIRRCEENLTPSPNHPGCIYGEMNRCLRPCQDAVSQEEYRHESSRVEQFLTTGGSSLLETAEAARDRASAEANFEEAERLHQRATKIAEVQTLIGPLAKPLDQLSGVAVAPCRDAEAIDLLFLAGGVWQEPRTFSLSETAGAGKSMDNRLRELIAEIQPAKATPKWEHLAILVRWHSSSWRDGEWLGFDSPDKIPYRKLVNAIGRVAARTMKTSR